MSRGGWGLVLALLAVSAGACQRTARAPRPDTTASESTSAPVSSTAVADSLSWPVGYQGEPVDSVTQTDIVALARLPARPRARAVGRPGFLFGMSGYKPLSRWCAASSVLNSSNMTVEPKYLLTLYTAAEACGHHFAFAFSRSLMTSNGAWNGPFSPAKAKALGEAYARALTPAQWARFASLIPYIYTLDDMGCANCWGGTPISQQTTADVMKALHGSLGKYAPLALRVHPEWMLRNGATKATWAMPDGSSSVDLTISQWYGVFSTQRPYPTQTQWYDRQRAAQGALGIPAQSYTVAYGGCYKATETGCPADKIKSYGLVANAYPGNCANIGWNWRDEFDREPYLSAVKAVATDAAGRPAVPCRRVVQ